MSYNYTLKYRTFDQLLEEINVDFQSYNMEGYIEPQQLIKVAKRVNYDLGLRIFATKEAVIEVEKFRAKLPDDFYVLNFSLICGNFEVQEPVIQGTHIEERLFTPQYQCQPSVIDTCTDPAPPNECDPCNTCGHPCCEPGPCTQCNPKPRVCLNCKGEQFELVQIIKSQTRVYKMLMPLKILRNPETIDCDCPNLYWDCPNTAWIKDGFLYTNFECGKVYVNYQGMMENEDGELLVPDHDMINEYYEYALKQRILENLIMNDEPVGKKLELVEIRLRAARNYALSIVNTPNFSEMKALWEKNRKAQYYKYYDMFKSYPWNQNWNNWSNSLNHVR